MFYPPPPPGGKADRQTVGRLSNTHKKLMQESCVWPTRGWGEGNVYTELCDNIMKWKGWSHEIFVIRLFKQTSLESLIHTLEFSLIKLLICCNILIRIRLRDANSKPDSDWEVPLILLIVLSNVHSKIEQRIIQHPFCHLLKYFRLRIKVPDGYININWTRWGQSWPCRLWP
jgi:hypothetical protein